MRGRPVPAPASTESLLDDQLALHAAGAMARHGAIERVRALLEGHGDGRRAALADHLALVAPDRYRVLEGGGVGHLDRDLAMPGVERRLVEPQARLRRADLDRRGRRALRLGAV